eukprot:CAMPEP_0198199812 /NCGR_PEP_ID=MMETSP1445-20131203/2966_1 /TAXON_ID=36898 /ORGANISM="Pyramimonas sp., Strain CCMP2087" /LENGTH=254 /DNA_ID=CAMNT_0043869711 /DNA_START=127 /DNA_END=887 /DNA_ORIENTATION=-
MDFSGLWKQVSEAAAPYAEQVAAAAAPYAERAHVLAQEAQARGNQLAQEGQKYAQEVREEASKSLAEAQVAAAARMEALALEVQEKGVAELLLENTVRARSNLANMIASGSHSEPLDIDDLMYHGISQDILDFVGGLTVQTFRDFPVAGDDVETFKLSAWQEKHVTYMLQICQEVNDFRYVLVPRRMSDERFWKVYFTIVSNQLERELERQSAIVEEDVFASAPPPRTPTAAQGAEELVEMDLDDGGWEDMDLG